MITTTIGFPRIGIQRQIKFSLERYWKKQISQDELLATASSVEADAWNRQKQAGIGLIGCDGTLYDQMLDTIYWLGVVPERFKGLTGLDQYFAIPRGCEGAPALDMSKYFDTNYHFIVPELETGWAVKPNFSQIVDKVSRCQKVVGESAVPIIIGPVTFVSLAKRLDGCSVMTALDKVLPAYRELLKQFKSMKVPEVQVHEPFLSTSKAVLLKEEYHKAFQALNGEGVPLHLVTFYDDLGAAYPWAVQLPVASITMDFLGAPGAAAGNRTLELIAEHGFPADKKLGAGVIDGRSVWAERGMASAILATLVNLGISSSSIRVTSSVPLQHVPLDLDIESKLPQELRSRLSFAMQKLGEIVQVARDVPSQSARLSGEDALKAIKHVQETFGAQDTTGGVDKNLTDRPEHYSIRRSKQIQLRPFPTTTIGSFPQTAEIRRLRTQCKKGVITEADYSKAISGHIGYAIGLQEAMDVDVLVHGESERTDMVEYFGQELDGMFFTEGGWVQSYGSRYVRPPIISGDVKFVKPITVAEFKIAQELTKRPVKGMLTGPVTILNWSFPRVDINRKSQAFQLATSLRQEVAALEAAGCRVIQVDEPALREGLPLKDERWDGYLTWAVDAFRVATAVAKPETQVVTHLCYSDFQDIMGAIDRMDADVLTIENSRSDNEMVRALANSQYKRDVGPGVYDVHSPVVPSVNFIKDKIKSFCGTGILDGQAQYIWVNPDCGLKTRQWEETTASLRNMVQAAREVREELAGKDIVKACQI